MTSPGPEGADARKLLGMWKAHWGVESRLFCVRDVTFREDQCRVRKGNGPQVLAAIRNTAITLCRRLGLTNIAAACRHFMMNYNQAAAPARTGRIE